MKYSGYVGLKNLFIVDCSSVYWGYFFGGIRMKKLLNFVVAVMMVALLGFQTTEQAIADKGSALTGTELKELHSGNTVIGVNHKKGRDFRIYHSSNGTISAYAENHDSSRPDSDKGKWWIKGNKRCTKFSRWSKGFTYCKEIFKSGNKYNLYSLKTGQLRSTFTSVVPGNPHNL
jgi:hypothetical protein